MPKLLFDLYGVLLRPATPEAHAELERFLAPANSEAFWEAYNYFRPDYDAGIFSDSHYWNEIAARAGMEPIDCAGAVACENQYLLEADPEMVALVKGLIGEGFSVGILSNIPTTLAEQVRAQHPWLAECAAVTLSCDIGVAKPHPEAYRVAVDALAAQPKDTHFFDDRIDYIEGATYCGLQSHLFTGIDSAREVLRGLE